MKFFLTIPLLFVSCIALTQVKKEIKVLSGSKVFVETPQKKVADKKTGVGIGSHAMDSKVVSKDLARTPTALGFFNAKTYTRTLSDGTKMNTTMFIKAGISGVKPMAKSIGIPRTTVKPKSQTVENTPDWDCNVEQIKVTLDDESFMNAANEQQSSNLYPGAIYTFDNFFNGSYKAETAPRRPFQITTSAQGVSGNVFELVENPSVSNIKNAVNKLFRRMPASKAISGYHSTIYECNSVAEQIIKLTGGGGAYGFSASFGVDMKNQSEYRNFVIDCTQEMYSVGCEMPDSGFFVNPENANKDGLMVMSNITYGQRVLVSLTTKMVSNEFGNKFDASYSGFGASAKFDLSTFTKEVSDETTVKIYIVGGSNPGLIETDKNRLMTKLNEYFTNTSLQNAKPISYQFKNMNDEVVQSKSASDYFTVRKCIPAPPPGVNAADVKWRVTVKLNSITNETDMQESIHLGVHQMVQATNASGAIRPENFSSKNIAGSLIYWGGYPMPGFPYEEPRTFTRNTNPSKSISFIVSQQDANDGADIKIISNYIAMVSTRIAGKTNESSLVSEEKISLKELLPKGYDTRTISINFNNRVFKFDYQLSAQKL